MQYVVPRVESGWPAVREASENYFSLCRNETNNDFTNTLIKICKFISYSTLLIPAFMFALGAVANYKCPRLETANVWRRDHAYQNSLKSSEFSKKTPRICSNQTDTELEMKREVTQTATFPIDDQLRSRLQEFVLHPNLSAQTEDINMLCKDNNIVFKFKAHPDLVFKIEDPNHNTIDHHYWESRYQVTQLARQESQRRGDRHIMVPQIDQIHIAGKKILVEEYVPNIQVSPGVIEDRYRQAGPEVGRELAEHICWSNWSDVKLANLPMDLNSKAVLVDLDTVEGWQIGIYGAQDRPGLINCLGTEQQVQEAHKVAKQRGWVPHYAQNVVDERIGTLDAYTRAEASYLVRGIRQETALQEIPEDEAIGRLRDVLNLDEKIVTEMDLDEDDEALQEGKVESLEAMARATIKLLNTVLTNPKNPHPSDAPIRIQRSINLDTRYKSRTVLDAIQKFNYKYKDVGVPEAYSTIDYRETTSLKRSFAEGKLYAIFSALKETGYIISFPEDLATTFSSLSLKVQL